MPRPSLDEIFGQTPQQPIRPSLDDIFSANTQTPVASNASVATDNSDLNAGLINKVSQGVSFGLADELQAGWTAPIEYAVAQGFGGKNDGKSLGQIYDQELRNARHSLDTASREMPNTSTALEIGGGLLSGGGALRGAGKAGLTKAETWLGRRVAEGTVAGTSGAIAGYGSGEGDIGNRLGNALEQGGIGVVAGPVLGATLEGAGKALIGKINPRTVNSLENGQPIVDEVSNAYKTAANAKDKAYQVAQPLLAKSNVGIDHALQLGQDLKAVTSQYNPLVTPEVNMINSHLDALGNLADSGATKVKLAGIENMRQQISNAYNPMGGSGNSLIGKALDTIDQHYDSWLGNALVSGNDNAISAIKDARTKSKYLFNTFSGDKADSIIRDKIVAPLQNGQVIEPEKVFKAYVGLRQLAGNQTAADSIKRLKNVVGEDSPAFQGLKQGFFSQIAENSKNTAGQLTGLKLAQNIEKTMAYNTFVKQLLSPEEISNLNQVAVKARAIGSGSIIGNAAMARYAPKLPLLGPIFEQAIKDRALTKAGNLARNAKLIPDTRQKIFGGDYLPQVRVEAY